jgi:hypothetical protein
MGMASTGTSVKSTLTAVATATAESAARRRGLIVALLASSLTGFVALRTVSIVIRDPLVVALPTVAWG